MFLRLAYRMQAWARVQWHLLKFALQLGHLSFAVGPVHSTTDNEAESPGSRTLRSNVGQEHGLEEVILEAKESQVGTRGLLIPLQSLALQRSIHTSNFL